MPPPDYIADAHPQALAAAGDLYDHVVAALDPLDAPYKADILRILWHSLADRYPAYVPFGSAGPSKRIPETAATHGTTEP